MKPRYESSKRLLVLIDGPPGRYDVWRVVSVCSVRLDFCYEAQELTWSFYWLM